MLGVRCQVVAGGLPSFVAIATIAALALAHPKSAHGQFRIEIAPAFGHYIPSAQMPDPGGWFIGCPAMYPPPPECFTPIIPEHQERASAFGARVTGWFWSRAAIEGSFWTSASNVAGSLFSGSGNVFMADVRAVFSPFSPPQPVALLIMAGPALIHRSGDAWANLGGTTSPALALGAAVDVHPSWRFGIRLQVDSYLYSPRFKYNGNVGESLGQRDLVWSVSTGVGIGRPRGSRE